MSNINSLKLIAEMRLMAAQARNEAEAIASGNNDFGNALKNALDSTNDKLMASAELKKSFVKGDPSVSLVDTMIAGQKAGLAFDAVLEVRNKLLQAYQEIMNMPI